METIGLILFLFQQLGMTLGVGASTFALILHVISDRDGKIEPAERSSLHADATVLRTGLFFIIVSGLLITAAHVLAGEGRIVLEPSFIGKWLLVGIVLMNGLLMSLKLMPLSVGAPLAGGSWYALFLLHNLAPDIDLLLLGILYLVWLALFIPLFQGIKYLVRQPAGERMLPLVVRDISGQARPMPIPASLANTPSLKQAYPPAPHASLQTPPKSEQKHVEPPSKITHTVPPIIPAPKPAPQPIASPEPV